MQISVDLSPDGKYLLTASNHRSDTLWYALSGKDLHSFLGHASLICSLSSWPSGTFVLTGRAGQTARVWDVQTGQELRRFTSHRQGVRSEVLSDDVKHGTTASDHGTARHRSLLWVVVHEALTRMREPSRVDVRTGA